MYATLKFDTEDVYYPPEAGIDDVPGWLAETMSARGVTGTFCIFGEKVQALADRGRTDVLEALKPHALLSHTQGNVRPLIPERVQDAGWADGVERMRAYEDEVAETFRRAFGRDPGGLSRHNNYFAAQHVAVAGERGGPYMTAPVGVPDCEQPVWYAGTLILPAEGTPGFGGFDRLYCCDDAFERRLRALEAFLDDCLARGVEYVSLFGCHPVQVLARGWLEHYTLAAGAQKTPQEVGWRYAVRSAAEGRRARANFARLVDYLADRPDVEMVGAPAAAELFASQPAEILRDELTEYAEAADEAGEPVLHRTFSPAEMLAGLVASLTADSAGGDVPYEVPRSDVLGPTERPITGCEADVLSAADVTAACREAMEHVERTGHVPANVTAAGRRVGAGQLLVVAARAYLGRVRGRPAESLRVPQAGRYPAAALEVDAWVRRHIGEHWAMDTDFSCERLAEHARLQTWSLKPAWLRPPRARPREGGRSPA